MSIEIHRMTPSQRAENWVYISQSDFETVQGIAVRLAEAYPSDWYERMGENRWLNAFLSGVIIVGLMLVDSPWWAFVVAPICLLALLNVPAVIFDRTYRTPRWNHHEALLTDAESVFLEEFSGRLLPVQQILIRQYLPCKNGAQFYQVWLHSESFASGHNY